MAARNTQNQNKVPGWVWLFTGAVLGAFVMFLLQLSKIEPNKKNAAKPTASQTPAKAEERKFDFYTLLKESEVPIDTDVAKDYEHNKGLSEQQKEYLLQVASFSKMADAEQLRAELILLNLNAHIEEANVRQGEKWHRVIVGPFATRSQFSKARSTLISNRYEAMILTRPKS